MIILLTSKNNSLRMKAPHPPYYYGLLSMHNQKTNKFISQNKVTPMDAGPHLILQTKKHSPPRDISGPALEIGLINIKNKSEKDNIIYMV